jgi:putative ABC transport system substrate-binding protein
MIEKILRGANAGDIPMEQPTVYELAVNRKTARALGIKVPQALLLRADRVVE